MRKNRRKFIATVTHGAAKTLQGDGSDVLLDIPEDSKGLYMIRVHTDHSRFRDVIPDEECIVGPIVEAECCQLGDGRDEKTHRRKLKILCIPHCVRDRSLWKYIRVRRGDIYTSGRFQVSTSA